MSDYPILVNTVSAHPFNIGDIGNTGPSGTSVVRKGPTGASGSTGAVGRSGPTGLPGITIIGITYSSTGPNAHHLIVQHSGGITTDGGYFRGPTGMPIYHLFGENVGKATAGSFFQKTSNGILYLKSITGGGGVSVTESADGTKINIGFRTFNSVQAKGSQGELVFFNKNSAGVTGLSGATLTNYQAGPTFALRVTTKRYDEVSGKIEPEKFLGSENTFLYKINPMNLLSLDAARKNRSKGNHWIIDPISDYTNWFGGSPTNEQRPFVRVIDSSMPENYNEYENAFGKNTSLGFTLIIKNGDNSGERSVREEYCPIIFDDSGNLICPDVSYKYTESLPTNWKFPYNAKPSFTNGIDIIQFISIGTEDIDTGKHEWYGMFVRNEKENPFY